MDVCFHASGESEKVEKKQYSEILFGLCVW